MRYFLKGDRLSHFIGLVWKTVPYQPLGWDQEVEQIRLERWNDRHSCENLDSGSSPEWR